MSAHTPGPWVADTRAGGVVRGGPVQQFVNGSGQQQVALATGQEYMLPGEQAANARLIAAAPDLLAWAEKSPHEYGCYTTRTTLGNQALPCTCGRDAAIAKAVGK